MKHSTLQDGLRLGMLESLVDPEAMELLLAADSTEDALRAVVEAEEAPTLHLVKELSVHWYAEAVDGRLKDAVDGLDGKYGIADETLDQVLMDAEARKDDLDLAMARLIQRLSRGERQAFWESWQPQAGNPSSAPAVLARAAEQAEQVEEAVRREKQRPIPQG